MRAPQLRARVRTGTGGSLISSLFIKSLAVVRIRFQRMLMFLLVEVKTALEEIALVTRQVVQFWGRLGGGSTSGEKLNGL